MVTANFFSGLGFKAFFPFIFSCRDFKEIFNKELWAMNHTEQLWDELQKYEI